MHLSLGMKILSLPNLFVAGVTFFILPAQANEVSPEERIREFQKPRGLSSASSSKSSDGNSKASNSQNMQSASSSGDSKASNSQNTQSASSNSASDPYAAMAKVFSDQMSANTKANEEIQKLIPKAEPEQDYLKSLAGTIKSGANSNVVATLSQITQATIASIKTLAEMQIAIEKSKAEEELAGLRKKQNLIRSQEIQAAVAGLSPMAVALGAVKLSGANTPSPISIRTRISTDPQHSTSKGLFPSNLKELSARAYNAPR